MQRLLRPVSRQARQARASEREALDARQLLARVRVEPQIGPARAPFLAAVERPAEDALRQRLAQHEAVPAGRQPRAPCFGHFLDAAQHLEARVEQGRMREQAAPVRSRRQQRLAQRFAGPRPEPGQAAEGRPVLEPAEARPGVPLQLRQAALQRAELRRLGGGRREVCPTTLGMGLPLPPGSPADDLPRTVLAEHHLNEPALVARQHQRALDRGLLEHDGKFVVRFPQRLAHLRRVERARRDHFAEHPVVCQPCRIPGVQLPLERVLAIRGIPLHAEERVARLRPPMLGRRDPVALPLKGIGGQRDPAANFTGEELFKGNVETRLVRTCQCTDKVSVSAAVAPLARDRGRLLAVRPSERRHRSQHSVRPDLKQETRLQGRQGSYRCGELDRFARVTPPIRSVGRAL